MTFSELLKCSINTVRVFTLDRKLKTNKTSYALALKFSSDLSQTRYINSRDLYF